MGKTLWAGWLAVGCIIAPAWAQPAPAAAAAAPAPAPARAPRQFVLENTQIIPLQSQATGRQHELIVSLPASYAAHPEKTYPVLYYLDAYWDTPLLTSVRNNLVYDNLAPEFIMVGLSYPTGSNYDVERRRDYTFTGTDADSGKGAAFLDFITKEAAPLIEARFRADRTGRVIGGNSLGGLFALAAAYKAPGFFEGHIAISPAASWDHDALARLDDGWAREHKALPARIFISYGSLEYPTFRAPIAAFQKQLAGRHYQGTALQNYTMEGLDHTTVKPDGYVRGLIWAWQPRRPPGPSGLTRAITQQEK